MSHPSPGREQLQTARRIVVKVGTRLLIGEDGQPNIERMRSFVTDMATLQAAGREVILVTSGAIGVGIHAMGRTERPTQLPELQMAAAIGQTRLLAEYNALFAEHGLHIAQVLLTHEDLKHRTRHLNARNTLSCLLENGVVPVVNENDAVSVDEIKLGDNDVLAALVTILVDAELLILLTTVEGFQDAEGKRVPLINAITPELRNIARGPEVGLSTGGMSTKLEAADQAGKIGAMAVIADGRVPGILSEILAGADVGTLVRQPEDADLVTRKRKHWLAFFHKSQGAVIVDEGAIRALRDKGTSLLPIGIKDVDGDFPRGALVQVKAADGTVVAQGLSEYSAQDLLRIRGLKSSAISDVLGSRDYDEAIHRDNLVIL